MLFLLFASLAAAGCLVTTPKPLSGASKYCSLQLLDGTVPSVAYLSTGKQELRLSTCSDEACTSELDSPVEDNAQDGEFPSMQLASDGTRVIAYRDDAADSLKVAFCDAVGGCNVTQLAKGAEYGGTIGTHTALALHDDKPFIVCKLADDSLFYVTCNDSQCIDAQMHVLITAPSVGDYNTIRVNNLGLPRIATSSENRGIRYLSCTDSSCNGTMSTNLGTVNHTGTDLIFVLFSEPQIPVFGHRVGISLEVIQCPTQSCVRPNVFNLVTLGSGTRLSATVSPTTELPLIAYDGADDVLSVATCFSHPCDSLALWRAQPVVTAATDWTSIAVSVSGRWSLAYHERNTLDLKLVQECPLVLPACDSTPGFRIIDEETNDAGSHCSLDLVDGVPYVAHYRQPPQRIMVLSCNDQPCNSSQTGQLDARSQGAVHLSMQHLNASEGLVIAYRTSSHLDLSICSNFLCVSPSRTTIDTSSTESPLSLCLWNDLPRVAYSGLAGKLSLVVCHEPSCVSRHIVFLNPDVLIRARPLSMQLDASGLPRIAHTVLNPTSMVLDIQVVICETNCVNFSSIAITSDGRASSKALVLLLADEEMFVVHISAGNVEIVRHAQGVNYVLELEEGDVLSGAMSPQSGLPVLAYALGGLRVARCARWPCTDSVTDWEIFPISGTALPGYTSVAVDASGRWSVAFRSNNWLNLAHCRTLSPTGAMMTTTPAPSARPSAHPSARPSASLSHVMTTIPETPSPTSGDLTVQSNGTTGTIAVGTLMVLPMAMLTVNGTLTVQGETTLTGSNQVLVLGNAFVSGVLNLELAELPAGGAFTILEAQAVMGSYSSINVTLPNLKECEKAQASPPQYSDGALSTTISVDTSACGLSIPALAGIIAGGVVVVLVALIIMAVLVRRKNVRLANELALEMDKMQMERL